MNNFKLILIVLLVSPFLFASCWNAKDTETVKEFSSKIQASDSIYVFVGMEWCQASAYNFEELFSKRSNESAYSENYVALFFSSEQYYDSIIRVTSFKGSSYHINSKGGIIDKYHANQILKKCTSHYKFVNIVPIMIYIDSTKHYNMWHY